MVLRINGKQVILAQVQTLASIPMSTKTTLGTVGLIGISLVPVWLLNRVAEEVTFHVKGISSTLI